MTHSTLSSPLSIVISHLTVGYKDAVVGHDLCAHIRPGALTALLGTNGTGKSTLLRTVAGLQRAISGEVLLKAGDHSPVSVATLSRQEMAQHIAVVLTEQPDVKQLTVSEIVGMGRMPYTGFFGSMDNDDRHIVQQALQDTGLARFANRYFDALSDGERQKVMIAKALAQQTPVIVLDEPTAFLDYPSKVEMMKILHHLAIAQGKTILLSTHDLELALQHADRLLILRDDLGEMTRASLADYIRSLR